MLLVFVSTPYNIQAVGYNCVNLGLWNFASRDPLEAVPYMPILKYFRAWKPTKGISINMQD